MNHIKAIILDVDGVIVGEKIGYNSPYPHPDVLEKLKELGTKGIKVSLCTAKPHYSIERIIKNAHLDGVHITQGGGVLINPINNLVYKKYLVDQDTAKQVIKTYIDNNTYIEFYSLDDYFIQEDQVSELTKVHTHILQKEPVIVEDLAEEALKHEIVKIMPISRNEEDKQELIKIFEPFENRLTLSWGIHPIALPHLFGIITAPGISKKQAVAEIAEKEKINPSEILAVGDSVSDWQFMEQCGFKAAMGNAQEDLKKLVDIKKEFGFIGGSVDENGILDIFSHFGL